MRISKIGVYEVKINTQVLYIDNQNQKEERDDERVMSGRNLIKYITNILNRDNFLSITTFTDNVIGIILYDEDTSKTINIIIKFKEIEEKESNESELEME